MYYDDIMDKNKSSLMYFIFERFLYLFLLIFFIVFDFEKKKLFS